MIVFFDLETGGLDMKHPIIQIAAAAVDYEWTNLGSFERKLKFDPAACDPEALRINHYTDEAWEKAQEPRAVLHEFAGWLSTYRSVKLVSKRTGNPYVVARVAGHNAQFDVDRLSAFFKSWHEFLAIDFGSVLDTRQGAIWYFEERRRRGIPLLELPRDYKLGTLARWFGIEVKEQHEALADVRLTIEVAKHLLMEDPA